MFTSNYSNAKIEMYDSGAKRSKHHGSANQDPADHNHRSAAIAVDKYAAHRSCTEGRKISLFFRYLLSLKVYSAEAIFPTDLLRT